MKAQINCNEQPMKRENKKKRIVIQGVEGCFHHLAAQAYYGEDVEVVPADNFDKLVKLSSDVDESDAGIMAIENSIAGSILPNYGLLQESGLVIEGEIFLRIKQNLLALPGQKIEDLREVHSHPMAIYQCRNFFRQYPHIKLVEAEDTALSAKNIREFMLYGVGAIAGDLPLTDLRFIVLPPIFHGTDPHDLAVFDIHHSFRAATEIAAQTQCSQDCFIFNFKGLHKIWSFWLKMHPYRAILYVKLHAIIGLECQPFFI